MCKLLFGMMRNSHDILFFTELGQLFLKVEVSANEVKTYLHFVQVSYPKKTGLRRENSGWMKLVKTVISDKGGI